MAQRKKIDTEITKLVNGFGGVIYIGGKAGFGPNGTWISIGGGTEMPKFELGISSVADWRQTARYYAAPWAEISSNNLAVTLPSAYIRNLDDPDRVANYWRAMMLHQDQLVGIEQHRKAPDRVNLDIGMPPDAGAWAEKHRVVAPLAWYKAYLEPVGNNWWGWFHENGHNHQAPAWKKVGNTSELTNNIVVLYAHHKLHGTNFKQTLSAWTPQRNAEIFSNVMKHLSQSPSNRALTWGGAVESNEYSKSKPMVKLSLFAWISEIFGWQVYKDAFGAYQAAGFAMPQNPQEQLETLVVELSRAANYDLTQFFELWGASFSGRNKAKINKLPVWQPTATKSLGFGFDVPLDEGLPNTDSFTYRLKDLRFEVEKGEFHQNIIWKKGGGKLRFDLQFDPHCLDCEGSNQIVAGIKGHSTSAALVWNGRQGFSRWNGWTGNLDLPSTPGGYEICFLHYIGKSGDDAREAAKQSKFKDCKTAGFAIVTN